MDSHGMFAATLEKLAEVVSENADHSRDIGDLLDDCNKVEAERDTLKAERDRLVADVADLTERIMSHPRDVDDAYGRGFADAAAQLSAQVGLPVTVVKVGLRP